LTSNLYVTTAKIGEGSGGGIVALHESKALRAETVVSMNEEPPFMSDYLCLWKVRESKPYSIAHFNGAPFGLTAEYLKTKGTKIFTTIPAHNLERSIEEHLRIFGSYPYKHMTDPYLWHIYTHHYQIADVVICPSRTSADYIKKKLSLKNEPVIIRHGCRVPDQPSPLPEMFTVGHLGQVGPDKGQHYLLQAWGMLALKAKLFLAGPGTEQLGGVGRIQDEKVFHDSISILVQPSVTEGYGIPVGDAMANGRPVIVTEGAGAHEIVEDGKEGFVIPIRDPLAIAEKIRYFYENPSEITRMGNNARKKAQRYSWAKIEKEYEKVYEE